jgi:hypothetical protein
MKSGIGQLSIREEDVVLLACPISTEMMNDQFNKSHRDAALATVVSLIESAP